MNFVYRLLFILLFIPSLVPANGLSQTDSLVALLPTSNDSNKVELLVKISQLYLRQDIKKSEDYGKQAEALANKLHSDFLTGRVFLNFGNYYNGTGDYQKALENLLSALNYFDRAHSERFLSSTANSIGNLYLGRKSYTRALDYYGQAKNHAEKAGNEHLTAIALLGMANVFSEKKDYDLALRYFDECCTSFAKTNDEFALAASLANMGTIYSDLGRYDEALKVLGRAMITMKKMGDNYGLLSIREITGRVYYGQKKYTEALKELREGLTLCKEMKARDNQSRMFRDLADVFKQLHEKDSAYYYMENYAALRDSLFTEENARQEAEMKVKFDTEKKQEAISMLLKEKEVNQKAQEVQRLENNRNRIFFYALLAGFILVFILALVSYRGYRQKRFANTKISRQKEVIELKNKEILDSILYAKRIQTALMASDDLLDSELKDYFILYKPKDIVSGDFYWAAKVRVTGTPDSKFILCTADCTGHGVPGAFMSLLGVNFLREIIKEKDLYEPNLVLDVLRECIIRTLNPSGKNQEESRDGMDAVLCAFDFKNMNLEFAAANNPVWIIRSGQETKALEVFKADKFPIGMHSGDKKEFRLQSTKLKKGDIVYTLTDGYADQFGGTYKKKLKPKQLKEILVANHHLPMQEQKRILEEKFESWRGDQEQVDDILIIGVRV